MRWDRARRRAALAAIALAAIAAIWPTSSIAVPQYEIGESFCYPERFDAYTPRVMRPRYYTTFRNPERVEWSPDLYRWNPRRAKWRLYRQTPWYYAFTSSYGFFQVPLHSAWHSQNGSIDIVFATFQSLPPGYYGVRHYLYWESIGRGTRQWSGNCYVS